MAFSNSTRGDDFWAITSYFNSMGYSHRRTNFQHFRQKLNAPLLAVELAYGPNFELADQDADLLIRLRGHSILWQKERLLNLALKALPRNCRKVAWLDCDIIFDAPDWIQSASTLLDKFTIVHLFSRVDYLAKDCIPGAGDNAGIIEFSRPSFGSLVSSGSNPADCIAASFDRRAGTSTPGFAWAARREILDRHGFYDATILGGGDTAMAAAVTDCGDTVVKYHYMNKRQQERYDTWAKPFSKSSRGEIGFLDGTIFHLWHGNIQNRRARKRHEGLQQFQFDPYADISIDPNGCWRWNSEKPEMHEYIRQYFQSRQEDG